MLSAHTGNFLVHQKFFSQVIQINSNPSRDAKVTACHCHDYCHVSHSCHVVMPGHNIYDRTLGIMTRAPGISNDDLSVDSPLSTLKASYSHCTESQRVCLAANLLQSVKWSFSLIEQKNSFSFHPWAVSQRLLSAHFNLSNWH